MTVLLYKLIGLALLALAFFYIRNMRAARLNNKTLAYLQDKTLVRITSKNVISGLNTVNLTPTKALIGNITSGGKPSVWMFVGEPTIKQLKENNIFRAEIMVSVPYKNLDPNKILYRKMDNTIAYLDSYEGVAAIQDLHDSYMPKLNYKDRLLFFRNAFIITAIFFAIVFLLFGFEIGLKIATALCFILICAMIQATVDKYKRRRSMKS